MHTYIPRTNEKEVRKGLHHPPNPLIPRWLWVSGWLVSSGIQNAPLVISIAYYIHLYTISAQTYFCTLEEGSTFFFLQPFLFAQKYHRHLQKIVLYIYIMSKPKSYWQKLSSEILLLSNQNELFIESVYLSQKKQHAIKHKQPCEKLKTVCERAIRV